VLSRPSADSFAVGRRPKYIGKSKYPNETFLQKKSLSSLTNLLVETLLLASSVVVEALVDVVAGLLLTSHHLKPHARVGRVVDNVQPQIPSLNQRRQIHDAHRGTVQHPKLDGALVNVAKLSHLVREVVRVEEPGGNSPNSSKVLSKVLLLVKKRLMNTNFLSNGFVA
jgi:hypothetical protein